MATTPGVAAGKRAYYGRRLITGIVRFIHELAAKDITITRFYTWKIAYLSTAIACINQPLLALRALLSTASIVVQAVIPARAILVRSNTGLTVTPSGPMMIMATGRPADPPPPPMPLPPLLACSD
ncbi:MAG TPA: hypothetical protein VK140_05620 [Ktedonobacteraceae bacterium]|nr:hypothetical protein [Ktedonobacteraceae bacterium]